MHVKHWPIAVVAFALTGTAAAQDARPRFEISPFVGYRTGGEFEVDDGNGETDTVDLDDDASFGIDLGLYRDGNSFYELLYSRQEAGVDSSVPSLSGVDVTTEAYPYSAGMTLIECGSIRERVSQELARTTFDAIRIDMEKRDGA